MAEEFKVGDYVWFTDEDCTHSQVRGQIGIIRSIVFGKTAHVEYPGLYPYLELPVQGLMHCHKEVPQYIKAALNGTYSVSEPEHVGPFQVRALDHFKIDKE